MNDLARILLGLAGVAANAFGVWAGAHAGMLSVGDGVIPCGAGGTTTDNSPTGDAGIRTLDNGTVTGGATG